MAPVARKRGETTGRSIVVASNRLPFTFTRTADGLERRRSPGGLVTALEAVLRQRGGTWVGWPGISLEQGEDIASPDDPYRVSPVQLTEAEVARYYHGFSNRTLWPLLHSMPDRAKFDARDWEIYARVNERMGSACLDQSEGAGLIWVHDYHLMVACASIRRQRPEQRLAFFLHVPFPPYDVFRMLPWDREILRALLACDLIGFHVRGYAWNFMDCVERSLGARVDRQLMGVEYGDRTTQIGTFPLGIDFTGWQDLAKKQPETPRSGHSIVLGVDRLDYTKGIPERLLAFERLLERYPQHRERVSLLQVAVPSRSQVVEYRELKSELDELVGRINGRFATAGWSPIRYLYRSFERPELAALYRDADIALITPLRDGMNLVAKEFIACQVHEPGVLVLSRLAGAGETMREALLVNPVDIDGTAEAIHRALSMEKAERRSRMAALRRRERRDNVNHWVSSFVEAAAGARAALAPLADEDFDAWLSEFLKTYQLALFLDYDGTLTPLTDHPAKAKLSAPVRKAVSVCAGREDTDVAVISGRALGDIRSAVGLTDLTYAGNHGLQIEGPGMEPFVHEDLIHYRDRAEELAKELETIANNGAWVELKGPTLTYHYRAVPDNLRQPLVEEATAIINDAGYQARPAHCAVEARPPIGWDKGHAVLHILRERYGPAWSENVRVIYVGDDHTDEDAFRFLAGLASTFRVGSADDATAATRRLPDVNAVRALLEWLGRRKARTGP
jgi:trehalose 6-phosphate synthase/phosphatase